MVELAEARVMNKKMLKKLRRHHGHRHGHDAELHDGDAKLCGALAPEGSEIVVVLRGKHHHHHHHHHHHYHADPSAVEVKFPDGDEELGQCHFKHRHHRRGRHGCVGRRVIEGLRGLKHHVEGHHHLYKEYCRGLGLDFQHRQHEATEAAAGPVTPTAPQAELMMKNLSLAEDKEGNKPI